MSKQVIDKIINGQKAINAFEIRNISKVLNVSVARPIEENKDGMLEKEALLIECAS